MGLDHKWLPKKEPWLPHDYDDDVIYAVRAITMGVANTGQQKLFWEYVMYLTGASETFADLSYRPGPDGFGSTAFAEGKKFVGLQLRKLLRHELTPRPKEREPHHHQPLSRRQIAQRLRRAQEKVNKERRNEKRAD